MLAKTMTDLGYKSSYAHPNIWLRPQTKDDGTDFGDLESPFVNDCLYLITISYNRIFLYLLPSPFKSPILQL